MQLSPISGSSHVLFGRHQHQPKFSAEGEFVTSMEYGSPHPDLLEALASNVSLLWTFKKHAAAKAIIQTLMSDSVFKNIRPDQVEFRPSGKLRFTDVMEPGRKRPSLIEVNFMTGQLRVERRDGLWTRAITIKNIPHAIIEKGNLDINIHAPSDPNPKKPVTKPGLEALFNKYKTRLLTPPDTKPWPLRPKRFSIKRVYEKYKPLVLSLLGYPTAAPRQQTTGTNSLDFSGLLTRLGLNIKDIGYGDFQVLNLLNDTDRLEQVVIERGRMKFMARDGSWFFASEHINQAQVSNVYIQWHQFGQDAGLQYKLNPKVASTLVEFVEKQTAALSEIKEKRRKRISDLVSQKMEWGEYRLIKLPITNWFKQKMALCSLTYPNKPDQKLWVATPYEEVAHGNIPQRNGNKAHRPSGGMCYLFDADPSKPKEGPITAVSFDFVGPKPEVPADPQS